MSLSNQTESPEPVSMRLDKFLAQCDVASRRKSADLIRDGRVQVSGRVERNPGYALSSNERKHVSVHGRSVQPRGVQDQVYLMLNKPKGYVTTVRDPQGRRTVMDLLPKGMPRIYPVGRLDYDSTGLLLMTNDGAWAQNILHPRHEALKTYQVWVEGVLDQRICQDLLQGIPLADGEARLEALEYIASRPDQSLWRISLREGRYREIRRLFATVGHPAVQLHRESVGSLQLGSLPLGKWRRLTAKEIRAATT